MKVSKIKSLIWIRCFKSYVLAEMKKEWKKEYVRVFHTDKYTSLHKVGYFPNVISFKGLCQLLSNNKTSEVSIFVLYICLFFVNPLNFNCLARHFSFNSQAWQLKFLEVQHFWIDIADNFMKEHKLQYRDSEDKTNGCIHQLSKYAGTLVRRQLCPHLKFRATKSRVDAEGKKVSRRNVSNNFDEEINVRENTVSDLTNVTQKNVDKTVEKDGNIKCSLELG